MQRRRYSLIDVDVPFLFFKGDAKGRQDGRHPDRVDALEARHRRGALALGTPEGLDGENLFDEFLCFFLRESRTGNDDGRH